MSVIQKIRDKYARIAVIAIAISLLGFILMDAFAGRTGLFNNAPSNTLGKVNGTAIDRREFDQKIQQIEAQYNAQQQQLTEEMRQQIMQSVWEQKVDDIILNEEYEKLGLTITDKELNELLYGANPPEFMARVFTDPKTGRYDAATARRELTQALKSGSLEQKTYFTESIDMLKRQRLMNKYMSLLVNSIYVPKWFLENLNVDNSRMGKISFVTIPYTSIPDSSVNITDEEIKDYMNKHKDAYEQKQETRSISYVPFNASASAKDSAAIREELEKLKSEFVATTEPGSFITQQNSTIPYYDAYLAKSAIQVPAKDTIFTLAKGAVYGPYLDNDSYVMAKMIDSKSMPDSAKAKHILIATNDPQSGQQILPDSIGKARIDSIRLAIERGANFDTLAKKFSDDKSSAAKGGLVQIPSEQNQAPTSDYFPQGRTVKNFNDSVFNGKPGQRKVVKTEFGYHLIEILDLKNIEPHYKVAYLSRKIVPGRETIDEAQNQANLFAGDSRDLKSFNENWEKKLRAKGINKMPATDIEPMANSLPGLPSARAFIRKVFDAKEGEVVGPEKVGENFVVAVVTEITEPGLKSVNSVRSQIEPVLRNRKKAEMIVKNLGKVTTPEDVAARQRPPVQVQSLDSVRFGGGQLGYEPRVLGALFNPANKGKVVPEAITGQAGVYVVRVENTTTVPVEAANVEAQRSNYEMQMKQSFMNQLNQGVNPIVEALKKKSTIKDNRSTFY